MQETGNENPLITYKAECDDVIDSLQNQLKIMEEEHKTLKEEIWQLMCENHSLSNKLDDEFKERLQESNTENVLQSFKSDIVINLQSQLDLSKKEKEKLLELYKTSLKIIEELEKEIALRPENQLEKVQNKVLINSPVINVLEAKLKTSKEHLEMALSEREKLENENIKHQTEIAKLKLNLEANNKIIEEIKLKEEELKNKCVKSEQNYMLLNATLECVTQTRNDLEKKVDQYSTKIQELVKKDNDSRSKVEEALDLVEKALAEKDASILREHRLQEEINKLNLCLEHVIEEAGKKVGAEVEETRKKFELNIKELTTELEGVKKELERKKVEHKRITVKYKKLEKLASAKLDKEKISLIKGSETEITILENHLDTVYQDLERFKIKFGELEAEKKKLEEEYSELIEKHQIIMKDKETREKILEEAMEELKSQINQKIEDINEASKRAEFFLNQVRELQSENRELKKIAGKCSCEKLKSKLKKVNKVRESQRIELETYVESQIKLNETWKKEIKDITEKYEERLREVKKEFSELKAKNKKMEAELIATKKKIRLSENV